MNLDELRSVQSTERRTDSLQHLRESFYGDVSAYISELETERNRRARDVENPFSDPEARRLTDEVEAARKVVEAIYDRRLGKIVKQAALAGATADVHAEGDGLTVEERELYDDLVELIETNRTSVLDVLEADPERDELAAEEAAAVIGPVDGDEYQEGATASPTDEEAASDASPTVDAPATTSGRGTASDDRTSTTEQDFESGVDDRSGASDPDVSDDPDGTDDPPASDETDAAVPTDRTTVRITGDVDEFFGVDRREYDLEPETVVTLPAENARPLLESGDAELVE